MSEQSLSPLMRQYREIKDGYPDAILFFRVGDFYEMFFEDAQIASRLLSIALTSRDKNSPDAIPLCGVPHHAAIGYIAKLLKAGKTVALCEQVEDPKLAKGLVRREVVRLYTPGTLLDTELLSPLESNYLCALNLPISLSTKVPVGMAVLDVSTGEFWVMECEGPHAFQFVLDELSRIEVRELLYPAGLGDEALSRIEQIKGVRLCERPSQAFDRRESSKMLREHFRVQSLDAFGCDKLTAATCAAGAVLHYLRETQPGSSLEHIRHLRVQHDRETMHLDALTIRNLELITSWVSSHEGGHAPRNYSLASVLDRTVTAMGARLLRQWLVRPLVSLDVIRDRLDSVGELKDRVQQRVALRSALREVQDIARLRSRIVLGYSGPRDLLALNRSLSILPDMYSLLEGFTSPLLTEVRKNWDHARDLHELIEKSICVDAPSSLRDGNIIKDGYDSDVDNLRTACKEGKQWIADLESKERTRTGIDSLKIRYNHVFGYYIEVTKSNLARVPSDFVRKQTLVNAERFMTPELKSLEERLTGAEVRLQSLEQDLFSKIRDQLATASSRMETIASKLSLLDVLAGLAEISALNGYTKPVIDGSGDIHIRDGRHPVVERLHVDHRFIPNDTLLDLETNRLLILTGPNMAGKSTYLRQVALIVLMAQVGCFVPAAEARIGVVDRIFTRVGASDNLGGGLSTFMVEMVETANILNAASQRSLILLDEIGRGTSTYDGLSIAWAIAEHIHDRTQLGSRTLFATHYHEMVQLADHCQGIKNYRVAVQERDGDVVFLRKIVAGGADRSYGIYVAKLAGLPERVIVRANEVLGQLERPDPNSSVPFERKDSRRALEPLPQSHPIIEEVKQIDLFSMTPLDAINRLAELQRLVTPKSE